MREQTVAMCCFLDDWLTHTRPFWARPAASHHRLTDAQVLTTALVAASGGGHHGILAFGAGGG